MISLESCSLPVAVISCQVVAPKCRDQSRVREVLMWLSFFVDQQMRRLLPSLKLTAKTPENGWLEYDCSLLGFGLFSGANCEFIGSVANVKNSIRADVGKR